MHNSRYKIKIWQPINKIIKYCYGINYCKYKYKPENYLISVIIKIQCKHCDKQQNNKIIEITF